VGLYDVRFVNAFTGWAVGLTGTILKTVDGGSTWVAQDSSVTTNLFSVSFTDASNGWAVGRDGVVVATTDGGATWAEQDSGVTTHLYGIQFIDPLTGWAVGTSGVIVATTDGGVNWTAQDSGVVRQFSALHFIDANHGWVVGAGSIVLGTSDGGTTWNVLQPYFGSSLVSVHFTDASNGWAAGSSAGAGWIMKTTDAGTTWENVFPDPAPTALSDVFFADGSTGWMVGGSGTTMLYAPTPDVDAPSSSVAGIPSGWVNGDVEAVITATDNVGGSGVADILYSLDGAAHVASAMNPTTITVSAEGTTTLGYRAVDLRGNAEATSTASIRIDKSGPTALAPTVSTSYTSRASVVATATDALSGVASIKYRLDGGATQTVPATAAGGAVTSTTIAVTALGSHTMTVWAVDGAGNESAPVTTAAFAVVSPPPPADGAPPVTTISGVPSGWTSNTVTFSLSAVDQADSGADPVGVKVTQYRLPGGAWTVYSRPVTVSAEGVTVVEFRSEDANGNLEPAGLRELRIDRTPPSLGVPQVVQVPSSGVCSIHWGTGTPAPVPPPNSTRYVLIVDGRLVYSGAAAQTTASIGAGAHTITVSAYDEAGNSRTETKQLVVQERPSPAPGASKVLEFQPGATVTAVTTLTSSASGSDVSTVSVTLRDVTKSGTVTVSQTAIEGKTTVSPVPGGPQYYVAGSLTLGGNFESFLSNPTARKTLEAGLMVDLGKLLKIDKSRVRIKGLRVDMWPTGVQAAASAPAEGFLDSFRVLHLMDNGEWEVLKPEFFMRPQDETVYYSFETASPGLFLLSFAQGAEIPTTISAPTAVVSGFATASHVTASLRTADASATPLGDSTLFVERQGPEGWTRVATMTPQAAAGAYKAKLPAVESATPMRIVLDSQFCTATPASFTLKPMARLSAPKSSTARPRAGRSFTIRGSLLPKHAAVVKVNVYKKVGSTFKRFGPALTARTTDAGTWSRSLKLPVGAYRFRASHADAGHAATRSAYSKTAVVK
jgi:photosystem II stability/assembly factor-like uncharacterized protein